MKLDTEEIEHIIDLLEIDTRMYKNYDSSKRLLSDSQKKESIKANKIMIKKLKQTKKDK